MIALPIARLPACWPPCPLDCFRAADDGDDDHNDGDDDYDDDVDDGDVDNDDDDVDDDIK